MAQLHLAQVGCGGMGLRHLQGLIELRRQGYDTFDLVAVCDFHRSSAEHVAGEAERHLGRRPRVFTDLEEMLAHGPEIDAVNVVTDPRSHHSVAIACMEAGKHVAVEKPMALTVRACHRMMEAEQRTGRVLSVSENYRRDPLNRLVRALITAGVVGEPRIVLDVSLATGITLQQLSAWRFQKLRSGYVVDVGTHNADLLRYFLGDVARLFAETRIFERVRRRVPQEVRTPLTDFYRHRVREREDQAEEFEATAEDTALGVLLFRCGAIGYLALSASAPGQPTRQEVVYGSRGSIALPGSRTGRPVSVTLDGVQPRTVEGQEVLDLVPDFALDGNTARMFGGEKRVAGYSLTFQEVDRKLIALELQDFAEAVLTGRKPEVTSLDGMKAVALAYALLESGHAGVPVTLEDVEQDRVNAYQAEINESLGL